MAWGKQLSHILAMRARILLHLLPDGRRVKSWCKGCVMASSGILIALEIQCVV